MIRESSTQAYISQRCGSREKVVRIELMVLRNIAPMNVQHRNSDMEKSCRVENNLSHVRPRRRFSKLEREDWTTPTRIWQ